MTRKLIPITALAVLALAAVWWRWHHGPSPGGAPSGGQTVALAGDESAPAAGTSGPAARLEAVSALGRLEPSGGVVDVGAVAGNRLRRIKVKQGDYVEEGQELAELQSRDALEAERMLLASQVAEAEERRVAELAYGSSLVAEAQLVAEQPDPHPLEIEAQRGKVKILETRMQQEMKDLKRSRELLSIVPEQERERQSLAVEQTQEELNSARFLLTKLEDAKKRNAALSAAKLQTAQAQQAKLDSGSKLDSLKQQLKLAEIKATEAVVRAPAAGQVLEIVGRAGELTGQKPIVKLGNTRRMTAVAEVYETDIHLVQVGQDATITSPALPKPLKGTVERIGMLVSKNEVLSLDPAAKTDARVVEVVVRLRDSAPAARLVNLQVSVRIDTRKPKVRTAGAAR